MECKVQGYIYKWGTKVGCTDYTIPEEVFKQAASEENSYPVTDASFCTPECVLGHARIKFDSEGVWTYINVTSTAAKDAILNDDDEKLKLGFMVNNVEKDEDKKIVTKCRLTMIDISESGIHPIECATIKEE